MCSGIETRQTADPTLRQEAKMGGVARYAERIRLAMKTGNNPTGRPISLKELGAMTGYSYESVRRVYNAEPVAGRPLNDVICRALGLDPDEMWELAQQEKIAFRLGDSFLRRLPHDKRLVDLWPRLAASDQERVIRIVEGLVLAREAEDSIAQPSAGKGGAQAR